MSRAKTRRQKAYQPDRYGKDRGDHGFTDEPTRLHFLDIDGVEMQWRDDPEGAMKRIVAQMGEPLMPRCLCGSSPPRTAWSATTTSAGPATSATGESTYVSRSSPSGPWTGGGRGTARSCEAVSPKSTSCFPPRAAELHPAAAVGIAPGARRARRLRHYRLCPGSRDYLAVPDDLSHTAHWAQAQGLAEIADHPDAEPQCVPSAATGPCARI